MDPELIPLLSTLVPLIVSASGLLGAAQKSLNDDFKIQLAILLQNYSPQDFARQTKKIFDSVFGEYLFSVRSFLLSCLTSIVTVSLAFIIVFGFELDHFTYGIFFRIAAVIVILNFIPDFLSLCQTRFIVAKMTSSDSAKYQILMLLLDFVLSALIIFSYIFIYFYLFHDHVGVLATPLGVDVIQVVVLSTMVFSILNFGFSIAVLLIAKTPKEMIYRFMDKPLILLGGYTFGALLVFSALPILSFVIYGLIDIGRFLPAYNGWVIAVRSSPVPPSIEILSVMLAFLFFLYLFASALSQCALTFKINNQGSYTYYAQLTFTALISVFLIIKLISPTFSTGLNPSPFVKNLVDVYFVPQWIPKWQIASVLNGMIVFSLHFYLSSELFDRAGESAWKSRLRDFLVRFGRILSATLSAYTASVLIYITASIQWDLLPICEAWTPWQNLNAECLPPQLHVPG